MGKLCRSRLNIHQTYYVAKNLNNTRYDDLGKLMKQSNFKVITWGELSQENNPLNQIKVYNQ